MIQQIIDAKSGFSVPIGTIDLFEFNPVHKHAGVGIMLLKEFQGQGIGKMALDQLLSYASDKLQLRSVYANVSETNTNSIKFFESYGFTKIAEYKEHLFEDGRFVSQYTYQYLNPSSRATTQ
jgi:diamine N-acetyltransferase